jgi:hypothetical protein
VGNGTSYTQAESAFQSEVANLQADSQTSQDDLPPACVPNLAADQSAALNDASKAAIDSDNVLQALNNGNTSLMLTDANASAKVADAADAKLNAVAVDLKAFEGSGS